MPTVPNVVGMHYEAALLAFVQSGVRVIPLGIFQVDPVTITWQANTGYEPGFVAAQNPASGTVVNANSNINLVCGDYPMAVVYPGGGTQV